jgi:SAM-dependent methyltransferase
MTCPVCGSRHARLLLTADGRDYWRCSGCAATFLHPAQLPAIDAEHAQYLRHENDLEDARYRRFLDRLAQPLLARLPPRQLGLDYGCGPGPALACILREAGHEVALYDPFFCPDPGVLGRTYDFITCTEVVEHFHRPAREFARLTALLRPGGYLAVMTCFQTDDAKFATWHYRRDPTHVVFYRAETFSCLARHYGYDCEIPAKDVVLMRRYARG